MGKGVAPSQPRGDVAVPHEWGADAAHPGDPDARFETAGAAARLHEEIQQLRRLKQSSDIELVELRQSYRDVQEQMARLKDTISYRIGSALVESAQSLRGAARLPKNLYEVFRASRNLKKRRASARQAVGLAALRPAEHLRASAEALALLQTRGIADAAAWARSQNLTPNELARTFMDIARRGRHLDPAAAAALAIQAAALNSAEEKLVWMALTLFEAGQIADAAALLDKAEAAGIVLSAAEARKRDMVRASSLLMGRLNELARPALAPALPRSDANRLIVFFAGQSLPYHVTAVSARLDNRVKAARAAGWRCLVVTPPGYPIRPDGSPRYEVNERTEFDGVTYLRLAPNDVGDAHLDQAMDHTGAALAETLRTADAALLHAEAYGPAAMSAAMGAQAARCALVLEIQDLVDPEKAIHASYAASEAFHLQAGLTAAALRHASVGLIGGVKQRDVLLRHGAKLDRVRRAAGGLSALDTPAPARDSALVAELGLTNTQVFGFVGALRPALRPERLVRLLDSLRDSHPAARLLLVGAGGRADIVRDAAARLRLSNRVVIVDRVLPGQVQAFLSLLDVAVFSGGPESTLATFDELRDAMAAACAIVVPGDALNDVTIDHEKTGLVVAGDDIAAMAAAVARLLDRPDERRRLGGAARAFLAEAHNMHSASRDLDEIYRLALAR